MVAEYFDGQLWPGRFIGQASGIVIFAVMTWLFLNEGINTKTTVSLILALCLFGVQIFWK
jgi:heme A synthase